MERWTPRTVRARGSESAVPREKTGTIDGGGSGSAFGQPSGLPSAYPPRTPDSRVTGVVTFVAGIWLLLAPYVLDYALGADGMGAYWNDFAVGAVLVVLGLIRALAPDRFRWLSPVGGLLGAWLVATPFVLNHDARAYAMEATSNDIAVGVVVFLMSAVSAVTTYQRRKQLVAAQRGNSG